MTLSQIKFIFSEFGLPKYNEWIRLPSSISEIQFANDARDYPDKTIFYKIDTEKEIIYTSRGHKQDEKIDKTKDYSIDDAYSIQYIDAFICSSVEGPYGTYYTMPF